MALARASWRRAEAEYRRDHLLADDAAQSNRPREVKAVGADEEVSTHWFREAGWEIYDAAAVVKAFRLGEKPPRYALWFGTFKSDGRPPRAKGRLAPAQAVATALLRCCVGEWRRTTRPFSRGQKAGKAVGRKGISRRRRLGAL